MKAIVSYNHRDHRKLQALDAHLAVLRREGMIEFWDDREISAGATLDQEIATQLDNCGLFLPLVSSDYLSSFYCYEIELRRAMELHKAQKLLLIPIILSQCDWKRSPLGEYKALPRDGKPISSWADKSAAYLDVVDQLRRLLSAHPATKQLGRAKGGARTSSRRHYLLPATSRARRTRTNRK